MGTLRLRGGRACAALMVAVLAVGLAGEARARGKRGEAPAFDVKALERRVQGSDAADVLAALAEARDAGAAASGAAPAVEELLRRGATPPIMKAALETLGALGQARSSAAIRPYVQHRAAEIRREAARAIAATRGPEAVAALRGALRSSDGMLRGIAAAGLGSAGAREALPDLFVALDRDVSEAAAAIGQLCDPDACRRLLGRVGTIDFAVMTSGLDGILIRPQPLPEDLLLEVVRRVRDLGTPEAGRYLADIGARWPAGGSPKVKAELEAAVKAVPGAAP